MSNGKKFMSAKTEFTTCTYGSIPQKIYIERSHGVINIKTNSPVLNANDYKYPENIKGYGRCSAQAVAIKETVEVNMPKTDKRSYAPAMQNRIPINVDCTCVPILNQVWQDCAEHYTIEGAPVLLEKSKLVCARGGIIKFDLSVKSANTKERMEGEKATFDPLNKKLKSAGNVLEDNMPSKVEYDLKIGDKGRLYGKWENNLAKKKERNVDICKLQVDKENTVANESVLELGAEYDEAKISAGEKVTNGKNTESSPKTSKVSRERYVKVEHPEIGSTEIKQDVRNKKITLENKIDAASKKAAKELIDRLNGKDES